MDITPHVNLLRSLRGERVDYVLLIGEGVDNAFDAGAHAVSIDLDHDHVEFVDNGCGITWDRMPALFCLGRHGPQATTALGRFGVGITSQAVNAGDLFEVKSTSIDGHLRAAANWRDVLKSNSWKVEDPRRLPVSVGAATGTTIKISRLRKAPRVTTDKVIDDLSLRFHPALASGRVIVVNHRQIGLSAEPALTDIVDCQLPLSAGRGAHLRAGLLVEPSRLNSVHIAYQHRVIMPGSRFGCGTCGGVTKMFARVQLSGPWSLAKFKNDLSNEVERDELDEALSKALEPILELCSSASMTARIRDITMAVNAAVPASLQPARPKSSGKDSTSCHGRKTTNGGKIDESKASASASGPARSKKPWKNQLIINIDGADADQGMGALILGRPHCVNLSPDNPYVASLVAMRDQDIAVQSLVTLALSIYLSERPELRLEPFGRNLAQLMSLQRDTLVAMKT